MKNITLAQVKNNIATATLLAENEWIEMVSKKIEEESKIYDSGRFIEVQMPSTLIFEKILAAFAEFGVSLQGTNKVKISW